MAMIPIGNMKTPMGMNIFEIPVATINYCKHTRRLHLHFTSSRTVHHWAMKPATTEIFGLCSDGLIKFLLFWEFQWNN